MSVEIHDEFYDKTNQINRRTYIEKGYTIKVEWFFRDGTLSESTEFHHGKYHGLQVLYLSSGNYKTCFYF